MKKIILNHTLTGEAREYDAVSKDYVLTLARLINIEEAEELLINKREELKTKNRLDLCIDLIDGQVKVREMKDTMIKGFNTMVPLLSCEELWDKLDFYSWIDDELEHLDKYLENIYGEAC